MLRRVDRATNNGGIMKRWWKPEAELLRKEDEGYR